MLAAAEPPSRVNITVEPSFTEDTVAVNAEFVVNAESASVLETPAAVTYPFATPRAELAAVSSAAEAVAAAIATYALAAVTASAARATAVTASACAAAAVS